MHYTIQAKAIERLLCLVVCSAIGELCKCLKHMHEYSGTLWEMDKPTDSLNHGFTSAAAVILVKALTGYKGLQDGIPVFGQAVTKEYGITVSFEYENYRKKISI